MTKKVSATGLLEGVPPLVQEMPWVQVLDKVYLEMLQTTLGYADNLRIYTQLDNVSEEVLDVLAVQFKVDWYDQTYPVETKRNIIKTALQVRRYYGTDWATETALCSVYPDSKVVEWYDYNGTPGHFRIDVDITDESGEINWAMVKKIIQAYKRMSAHLDRIAYIQNAEPDMVVYSGAKRAGIKGAETNWLPEIKTPTLDMNVYSGIQRADVMGAETNWLPDIDWLLEIKHIISEYPTQTNTLTYTGAVLYPTWSNYNSAVMTMTGTTSATSAGTYTVTFTPTGDYTWMDGTQDAVDVTWTIGEAVIILPYPTGTLTYTGEAQSPTWVGYGPALFTMGGTTSATDAGLYATTFTPKGNYRRDDGTQDTVYVMWSIEKAVVSAVPYQSDELTYTGDELTPEWNDYDSDQLTMGGTTSATDAGEYVATFTPKANYKWANGTSSAETIVWSIGKAEGSMSLSSTSESIFGLAGATTTVKVTRLGDGIVSAVSSDTGVATVSVSGTNVIIASVATGSATITVSVDEGTNYTAPDEQTIEVTTTTPSATLNDNTPEFIQLVARAGVAADYWSVGDSVNIALSGTVGYASLNGNYCAFIIGFDHNSDIEGTNTIHFQFGKNNAGTDIAFVDGRYGNYASTAAFRMRLNYGTSGGWSSSYMRGTICPAFLSAMPSEWQNIISPCTKYSDNRGYGSNTASYVTSTSDSIWLLAEWEVFGKRTRANSAEQNYQKQYAYYANGNSKVKYKHNATSTTSVWWLRSVYVSSWAHFCCVNSSGAVVIGLANYSYGFAPGFMVA